MGHSYPTELWVLNWAPELEAGSLWLPARGWFRPLGFELLARDAHLSSLTVNMPMVIKHPVSAPRKHFGMEKTLPQLHILV